MADTKKNCKNSVSIIPKIYLPSLRNVWLKDFLNNSCIFPFEILNFFFSFCYGLIAFRLKWIPQFSYALGKNTSPFFFLNFLAERKFLVIKTKERNTENRESLYFSPQPSAVSSEGWKIWVYLVFLYGRETSIPFIPSIILRVHICTFSDKIVGLNLHAELRLDSEHM